MSGFPAPDELRAVLDRDREDEIRATMHRLADVATLELLRAWLADALQGDEPPLRGVTKRGRGRERFLRQWKGLPAWLRVVLPLWTIGATVVMCGGLGWAVLALARWLWAWAAGG